MLKIHGFLSDAEADKVQGRINKWLNAHGYRVKPNGMAMTLPPKEPKP